MMMVKMMIKITQLVTHFKVVAKFKIPQLKTHFYFFYFLNGHKTDFFFTSIVILPTQHRIFSFSPQKRKPYLF